MQKEFVSIHSQSYNYFLVNSYALVTFFILNMKMDFSLDLKTMLERVIWESTSASHFPT